MIPAWILRPRVAALASSVSLDLPWLLLAAALLCTPALIYWSVTFQSAHDLGYGEFLGKLEKGEIRSAKVGPDLDLPAS